MMDQKEQERYRLQKKSTVAVFKAGEISVAVYMVLSGICSALHVL